VAERKRVLVTFASKMGSTQEVAEFVGHELKTAACRSPSPPVPTT
jgi:menaquinone-dependent protoporphyrinogen IX oxidase